MQSFPEAMEYVPDIRTISLLFHSWSFIDIASDTPVRFCTWFGDHVTVPRMTEAIYIPMTLPQIVAFSELNQRPPDLIRNMELSYRGHILQGAHENCDQLYAEGRARFNLTANYKSCIQGGSTCIQGTQHKSWFPK